MAKLEDIKVNLNISVDEKGVISMGEDDQVLEHLRYARAFICQEQEEGGSSRDLSVALTNLDTAILWRQSDLQKKNVINEADD